MQCSPLRGIVQCRGRMWGWRCNVLGAVVSDGVCFREARTWVIAADVRFWCWQVMGRMVRHTELAERWVERVERASHTPATYEFLESVLEDAEQFLWGGHEMDSVGCCEVVGGRLSGWLLV